ncbi:MAG: hypothetical protein AAGA33_14875, partial [Pseudomonadota bacterium]
MNLRNYTIWLLAGASLAGCGGSGGGLTESTSTTEPVDTGTGVASGLTADVLCDYSDTTFNAQPSLTYTSTSTWTCAGDTRSLSANGIPDHDVGEFPNPGNPNTIVEQNVSASFTLSPSETAVATGLGGPRGVTAYVLNGVKIDANTAGSCDDSGNCSLVGNTGQWNIEALSQDTFDFGTD